MQNQYNSCGVVEHDSADIELYIASGDLKKEAFSATTKIRRTSVSSNTRVLVFWKNGSEEGRINRLMDKIGAASDEWKQCARQKRIAHVMRHVLHHVTNTPLFIWVQYLRGGVVDQENGNVTSVDFSQIVKTLY